MVECALNYGRNAHIYSIHLTPLMKFIFCLLVFLIFSPAVAVAEAFLPSLKDIEEFSADPLTSNTNRRFRDFKIEREDLETILRKYHVVTKEKWLYNYSHVAFADLTGTITLRDKTVIQWLARPGGLAMLTFPDKAELFLANEITWKDTEQGFLIQASTPTKFLWSDQALRFDIRITNISGSTLSLLEPGSGQDNIQLWFIHEPQKEFKSLFPIDQRPPKYITLSPYQDYSKTIETYFPWGDFKTAGFYTIYFTFKPALHKSGAKPLPEVKSNPLQIYVVDRQERKN